MRPKRCATRSVAVELSHALPERLNFRFLLAAALLALAALIATSKMSRADENGASFWIPGFFGSLAAAPQQPGWSAVMIYYHTDVSASGSAALSREISIGQFNPTLNVNVNANIHGVGDLGFAGGSYVFATPFLGGQASASMLGGYGRNDAQLNGTIGGTLAGLPLPNRMIDLEQATWGFTDLVPQFAVRWNAGVNNYMTYITGDVPVGLYHSSNLANMGLGHGAIDGGVGYTYFDPKTGHEFSVVTGLTGNFENTSTNYTSGVDWHLDWGASQFLSKQVLIGLVGYAYDQITPDRGCAPVICPFESRVFGVGPQFGYIFPAGSYQGYINVKAYREFDNNARPDGWNAWLTVSFSPAAATPPPAARSIITK
jgi:hypothetical protein